MAFTTTRRLLLASATSLALTTALIGTGLAQETTLSFLIDNSPSSIAWTDQLVKDFEAANPDIKIDVETRLGGTDGDNIVKTRLATGEMSDVFVYNAGSLFQAINPTQNLADLSAESWQANVLDTFKQVVTADGKVYGAPFGAAMGGGIYYNRKIYADLGLTVPKTWADFMANNAKIKEAGTAAPVIQSFADSWTAQLFVLADYYNVQAAVPDFATEYTANKVKFATTPAAVKGFEHQKDIFDAGYLNDDYAAASYDEAIAMLATGEGAHYPMLTMATSAVQATYPENLNDIGFFAMPGDDAAKNGLTVWMPAGLYIPATSPHVEQAKKFLAYVSSVAGCDSISAAGGATGPYLIKDCTLPADVPLAVSDLLPYFQEGGANAPALEYLSPVKGPNLSQITVEVGSGIRSPEEGAALYDDDVKKQAQQLGLAGW